MRTPRKTITNKSIASDTIMSQYRIESYRSFLNDIDNDPRKDDRLKKHECKACYYRKTMVGQAFSERQCAICPEIIRWHNTGVPVLCLSCAKSLKLCTQCGGTISGKKPQSQLILPPQSPNLLENDDETDDLD